MSTVHISLNQFVEYTHSTTAGKKRILKNQKKPDGLLIPWYQLAKASLKKYLIDVNDISPISDGLDKLNSRSQVVTNRQKTDRDVSIEVLQRFVELQLSNLLGHLKYSAVKAPINKAKITFNGVQISLSPELIFSFKSNGKNVYGCIKIHISKTKPFNLQQCQYSSWLIAHYLDKNYTDSNSIVEPMFCLTIDVFSNRIVPASRDFRANVKTLKSVCEEIRENWISA